MITQTITKQVDKVSVFDVLTVEDAQKLFETGFSLLCGDGHVRGFNYKGEVKNLCQRSLRN